MDLNEYVIQHTMEHDHCTREEAEESMHKAIIASADLTDEDMAEFDDCMPDEEWWENDAKEIAELPDDLE